LKQLQSIALRWIPGNIITFIYYEKAITCERAGAEEQNDDKNRFPNHRMSLEKTYSYDFVSMCQWLI